MLYTEECQGHTILIPLCAHWRGVILTCSILPLCAVGHRGDGWRRAVTEYIFSHSREQTAWQGLCEKISNHAEGGAEHNIDDPSLYGVRYPEETDIDVSGLLCGGATALNEFDSRLVILIDGDRERGEALCNEKASGPDALL